MDSPKLSVIIPTLNEAGHLPAILADLKAQQDVFLEIIVGDGGSTDATRQIAEEFGANFAITHRGRGMQMNAAAARAGGEFLLFLHADSRIDDPHILSSAVCALREEMLKAGRKDAAGHFPLRFVRALNSNAMSYRYLEEKTAFNRANTTNGDQGLLLTKEYFTRLGGFDESLPFLEDQRMAENIRATGTWITLPGYLRTSARRFETEGFKRRYILMSMIMGLYSCGIDSFFIRAPGAYRVQHDTGKLLLTPFFVIIWQMMRDDWGLSGSIRTFYYLGRYIRQNSWQMFYFFDVWARPLLGPGRYPTLAFHDRFFWPLTDFRIFNAVTGMLCFVWFMVVLAPFFWLRDYKDLKIAAS